MERTNFEKLHVYKLSEKLADSVWHIVIKWDSFAKDTVGKQIVRAADSIAEHFRREWPWKPTRQPAVCSNGARLFVRNNSLVAPVLCEKALYSSEVKNLRLLVQELAPKLNAFLRSVDKRVELK